MTEAPIEKHPLEPFIPNDAKFLMLGSFPPKREKWSMEFFYPNWINDMWRIMGLVFHDDKEYFIDKAHGKRFDKDRIIRFCEEKGIALYDTACEVRRLKDNASDKFLEIVKATDLRELLAKMPDCKAIISTGQKATDVIIETFGCKEPSVGHTVNITLENDFNGDIQFWRMPSSSRAYPLALDKKAEHYKRLFSNIL